MPRYTLLTANGGRWSWETPDALCPDEEASFIRGHLALAVRPDGSTGLLPDGSTEAPQWHVAGAAVVAWRREDDEDD